MNEIDEIKRRMEKRRAHHHPTLTDRHFSRLYNGMYYWWEWQFVLM